MINLCKRIADSESFQSFILFLIVINGISMGLETFPELLDQFNDVFLSVFVISQIIFVVEILIRVIAFAPKFRGYFNNFWNTFDFVIVALSLIPAVGAFATVARLSRLLRVLRVVAVSKHLGGFVERLSDVLDEVLYSSVILLILSYIFSISGYYLFSEISPEAWGSLGQSMLTVFYLFLLQDVPAVVAPLFEVSGMSVLYFIVFYIVYFGFGLAVVTAAITQSLREHR